jgi:glutamine cyclotransferase
MLSGSLLLFAVATLSVGQAPVYGYKVVARLPHATSSYTEGFFYLDGLFYESTGLNGRSALMAVQPETGKVLQEVDLPKQYFGEGTVNWGANLYEWTWQSHVGFIYDRFSLRQTGQFSYSGEGWGMTHDGTGIITSDGSATLRFRDPVTFKEIHYLVARDGSQTIALLNELEFVKGEIYANVWHSNRIARISPRNGHVLGWIDLTGLLPDGQKLDAEYDPQHDRLFVTGKQWPAIFEIKVLSPAPVGRK